MLILNVANSSVTSSTQRRVPSINTQYFRSSRLMFKVRIYCTWRPIPDGTPANIHIYLIFLKTRIIGLHFAADNWNFYDGLCKTILFLQEWRFGRSRSSKVIDFGTNRKRVCDFLLVRHSNLGPILHRFGDVAGFLMLLTPPLFNPIFLGVPVGPDRPCWGQSQWNYFGSIPT